MADTVTIPADLAADVAARRDAYRPLVARYDEVLTLTPGLPMQITGRVLTSGQPDDVGLPWITVENHPLGAPAATAWALVGSVDGGPRPDVGDRVLVLAATPDVVALRLVGKVGVVQVERYGSRGYVGVDVGDDPTDPCLAARWAILPPAPDEVPSRTPEQGSVVPEGGSANFKPADDESEDAPVTGAAGSRPDLDRLPPGARAAHCGVVNADFGFVCTYDAGHGPLQDREGFPRDHGVKGQPVFWNARPPDLDWLPPGALPASQLFRAAREDALGQDARAARQRADALLELAEGGVPDGEWRVGGHCPRNLWIGPPRPYGVDVGRMDSPELAAYVVEAVNERERLRAAMEHIEAAQSRQRETP